MRLEWIVGGICCSFIAVVAAAAILRSEGPEAPSVDPSYLASASRPSPAPIHAALAHRWITRRGSSFGYQSTLSDADRAIGLATNALVMIDFNGMVQGDYSFTTYNPVSGNMIVMRCAEPCEFMNVMNYDHRMPETYSVAPGSVMQAIVLDARGGFLNP